MCWFIDLFEVVDRRAKSVVEDLSEEQSDLQPSGTLSDSFHIECHNHAVVRRNLYSIWINF